MTNCKKKILMISCTGMGNGGVQNVLMSIVRNLSDKYTFDVVCSSYEDYFIKEFESYGGKVFYIPNKNTKLGKKVDYYIRYPRIMRAALNVMKENGPYQAIHCHNYFEAAAYLRAAEKAGIRVRVSHSHSTATSLVKRNKLFYAYEKAYRKIISKYATKKIGCSHAACRFLFGDGDASVVNNAIDLKKFDPARYEAAGDNSLGFIHVGKLCKNKNQSFILDVFRSYLKKDPHAYLTLIGSGEDREMLLRRAEEYGLSDNFCLLSSDANVAEELNKADCFVFPSKFEGLGIVLIEAQAMGVHCFASDVVPGEADLGGCTFLPLSDGADKWAEAIWSYYDRFGKEKRYVDMSSYDIKNVIAEYDAIYSAE